MNSDEFWQVEIGIGMGPLALGIDYDQLMQGLRNHHIDVDNLLLDRDLRLSVPPINCQLLFTNKDPRTLRKIEVNDPRIRFGGLPVIGKRIHEILGMFKVSRKETLWCTDGFSNSGAKVGQSGESEASSRQLLASGTLWVTSLGLGMTLRDGLIETVHLCNPADSPSVGLGPWTKEQQRLSEVREMPVASGATQSGAMLHQTTNHNSMTRAMMFIALFVSAGLVVWWGVSLQRSWDAVPDVPAVVVAVDPPPPAVFPNKVTVAFTSPAGIERQATLDYTQFVTTPKLGDEVNVKYLPDSPDMVLGPVGFRDVGFNTAFPYGMGILAIGSALQLVVSSSKAARRRKNAFSNK